MGRHALLILLVLCGAAVGAVIAPRVAPMDGARQALVVVTADWDSVPGTLRRFQRESPDGPWKAVGEPIPVVVGKSGLGWGIGLHGGPPQRPGPVKHEGDGRAPAGVFRIGDAFGYAPHSAVKDIHIPYIQVTGPWKCVDDSASSHYNQVLDERKVSVDWKSHEDMRRKDDAYKLGAIVEHNWGARTRPAAGSCIFLHIWSGPGSSTVGCTAMAQDKLRTVLTWLEPSRAPVLVQLPREQYDQLRTAWRLP